MPQVGAQDPEPSSGVKVLVVGVEHRADREGVPEPVQRGTAPEPRLDPGTLPQQLHRLMKCVETVVKPCQGGVKLEWRGELRSQ